MVRKVSAVARNRRLYTVAVFCAAIAATSGGTVKTTWKDSTSSRSAVRSAIQAARFSD